jgi:hypothetical protein
MAMVPESRVACPCEHDHRGVRGALLDLSQGFDAVHAGHLHVEHHDVEPAPVLHRVHGLIAVVGGVTSKPLVLRILPCCSRTALHRPQEGPGFSLAKYSPYLPTGTGCTVKLCLSVQPSSLMIPFVLSTYQPILIPLIRHHGVICHSTGSWSRALRPASLINKRQIRLPMPARPTARNAHCSPRACPTKPMVRGPVISPISL